VRVSVDAGKLPKYAPGLVRKLYQQKKSERTFFVFGTGAVGVSLRFSRCAAAASARNTIFAGAHRAPRPALKTLIGSPPARRDVAGAHV